MCGRHDTYKIVIFIFRVLWAHSTYVRIYETHSSIRVRVQWVGYPYLHDTSANKNVHASNASRTTHLETQFQTITALSEENSGMKINMSSSVLTWSSSASTSTGFESRKSRFFPRRISNFFSNVRIIRHSNHAPGDLIQGDLNAHMFQHLYPHRFLWSRVRVSRMFSLEHG